MAKPQRKSINDALAEVAAQGQMAHHDNGTRESAARENVERDHVARESVPPAPTHIALGREFAPPSAPSHVARGNATTHHLSADTDADGYRVRVRRERPHASLYCHPRVFAVIRDLANAQRRKPHDLYIEGLRLMLAQYGYDYDELEGRGGVS
jgi:hypothetical protein